MEDEAMRRKSIMLSKLYDASLEGDLPALLHLLHKDPFLLDRCIIQKKWSPIHVASLKGHLEIARALLKVKLNTCFDKDRGGKNPVHVAAIEGHIDMLDLFYHENPHAAKEPTNDGETILHLCVKHNHMNTLEKFLELTKDVDLLNYKDSSGNTILHLEVAGRQIGVTQSNPSPYRI